MKRIRFGGFLLLAFYASYAFSASNSSLEEAHKAYAQKDFQQAYSILQPLSQDSTDPELFLLLGHAACKLEKFQEAMAAFERAVRINPGFVPAYMQLGLLYEKSQELDKARQAWRKVVELAQNEPTRKFAQKHLENIGG